MLQGQPPLDAFPLVRSADLDQLQCGVATLFQDSTVVIGSDRQAVSSYMNYCPLQHTGILYGNYSAAIDVAFGEMPFFVHGVTLRGKGEQVTNGRSTSANVGGLLSPGAKLRLCFGSGFEHLALKIEADALRRKLGAMIGASPTKPIRFEVDPHFNHPAAQKLGRCIRFLVGELSVNPADMPAVALAEMEQTLMIWFLIGNRHNYNHLLDRRLRSVAPWQVRRVEEYIEANWDQPVTIEALAAVTGASGRSIFHAFKQSRGYSPIAFLKQVRLRRAWQILSNPNVDVSVTDVAYTCGFSNLGHFAKYFRDKFGEAPSAVLSRSKGHLKK